MRNLVKFLSNLLHKEKKTVIIKITVENSFNTINKD